MVMPGEFEPEFVDMANTICTRYRSQAELVYARTRVADRNMSVDDVLQYCIDEPDIVSSMATLRALKEYLSRYGIRLFARAKDRNLVNKVCDRFFKILVATM